MKTATVGSVEICYDTFGHRDDPAMLLIMGLGMQMTGWDSAFCRLLASRGYYVVRYDHRDIGLSSTVNSDITPNIVALWQGGVASAVYTLDDLAADAIGLLDALGIDAAHVVGASMGAMVAQLLAIDYPRRVLSLTSMMGTTGDPSVGRASAPVIGSLLSGLAAASTKRSRESVATAAIALQKLIGSPAFPLNERQVRAVAERSYDRSPKNSGHGVLRQLAAIMAARDRTQRLGDIAVPTLVIHGANDSLVDVSGGEATAKAIPQAELVVVEGMGHDLPAAKWPEFAGLIDANCRRANPQRGNGDA